MSDTHQWAVQISSQACYEYINQFECENAGCYWYNNFCYDSAPTCAILDNNMDCTRYGCYWYNGSCHAQPQEQPDYSNYMIIGGLAAAVLAVGIMLYKRRKQ